MSGNSLINIGVGIVFAAAVIFTGGTAAAALFAFSAGATASALLLGADSPDSGTLRPDEIQINQSAEDATIPVVFGTTRLSPNFIYVGFDELETETIYTEQSGGKGGGSQRQESGITYRFPISYGICMGEIDTLNRVMGSPGQDEMTDFAEPLEFTDGNPETFTIEYEKEQGEQTYIEGGSCDFYPGSPTQGSDAELEDKNHRNVCWVDFPSYRIDGSPSPRTLLFEISRMPQVLDDDGIPVVGFPNRAANEDSFAEWNDANPAAIAWEILRNPIWGKGMKADRFDVDSFRQAAIYYATARIGVSTAMGKQTVTSFMGRMRDIFGLWIWWDGVKTRARCIYDQSTAYSPRPRLQADDVIGTPQFNRPALSATYNEIRLEFTNRENNWQSDLATAMDLAHVETVEGIRSQSIDGAEIGTRRSAEMIAHALLRQMAYPSATAIIQVRRTYSGLQPGSFVEFVWEEWRDTGVATTFWRVVDITDDDQGSEGVTLTLVEDLYATAIDGLLADGDFTAPVPTINNDIPLENDDLVKGDLTAPRPPGNLEPIRLWEPNSFASLGERRILVAPTREKSYVQSVSLGWSTVGDMAVQSLPTGQALPINGKLLTSIPATGEMLNRSVGAEFQIELYPGQSAAKFEAATGLVQSDTDHFAALTDKLNAILLINGEAFRVGFAEETSPGVMTIKTFIRGELGTTMQAHAIDDQACFFPVFNTALLTEASTIPTTSAVEIQATPNTVNAIGSTTTYTAPPGGSGVTFSGDSIRPFRPEIISASRVGTVWTIKIRPRAWQAGAGTKLDIQDDAYSLVSDLNALDLRINIAGGSDIVTVPAGTSFSTPPYPMPADISLGELTWIPDSGAPDSGTITLVVTFAINPANLEIRTTRNGVASEALTIPQPT